MQTFVYRPTDTLIRILADARITLRLQTGFRLRPSDDRYDDRRQ